MFVAVLSCFLLVYSYLDPFALEVVDDEDDTAY